MTVFDSITEYWSPKIVAEMNGSYLKAAKLKGEFTWHSHPGEDELFRVVKGTCTIQYEGGEVVLAEGDVHVVPAGVRHCPKAAEECWVTLVEPVSTAHTGDTPSHLTKTLAQQM